MYHSEDSRKSEGIDRKPENVQVKTKSFKKFQSKKNSYLQSEQSIANYYVLRLDSQKSKTFQDAGQKQC